MFEFVKWCFRDANSTVVTLIILSGLSYFVLELAKTIKK